MPEPRAVTHRVNNCAGDSASLVQLGLIDPQPTPGPPPDRVPPSGQRPDPADEAEKRALTDALAEAGVEPSETDRAAVQALASLDSATVDAVTRWLKAKKKPDVK
ncbi:hypothetical protein ABZY36_35245 [Streptomyces sp. NPDC006627]|uniref:hypothetical protein n=1 Tax=Streptomyces sp. NPDC006627 TaxID=3154679 RepID=UPI0033BCDDEA